MSAMTTILVGQQAPCEAVVDAEHREDRDGDCLLTDDVQYACGCRRISHEYHDGAVSCIVIHHDGTVLIEQFATAA